MSAPLNNNFNYTTFRNLEQQMTEMIIHQYWKHVLSTISNKDRPIGAILDNDDYKKIQKDGEIHCLVKTLHEHDNTIQHLSTFDKAIGK